MNIHLTEEIIRGRANAQSYQKGLDYYDGNAIYDPTWQAAPNGIVLMAHCEGSDDNSYRLRVELDPGGVQSASCTCPYDWGGDCKHIIALLLMYLRQPEEFTEQKGLDVLLAGLEKADLLALITRLVQNNPDLYDEVELFIPAAKLDAQPLSATPTPPKEKRPTQVSQDTYRKQIRRIFKQSRYENEYEEWGSRPAYLDDLETVQNTAMQFLQSGDAEGALIILRTLLEETLDDYEGEADYEGDAASFIQGLGMPLAEAILSADLDEATRQELEERFGEMLEDLDDAIESSELEVILDVLEYGWRTDDGLLDEESEIDWLTDLQTAQLNVLERQGRNDEFLALAEKADPLRYTLKLLELGQIKTAITASAMLYDGSQLFVVAQKLREMGHLQEAIALAEQSLQDPKFFNSEMGKWLAPLEEAQGKPEIALQAYHAAYNIFPTYELYRHIKRLAGPAWPNTRPALMQKLDTLRNRGELISIHLDEGEWDAAIALAEQETWYGSGDLERVAEAVIPHRPEWVIRISLKKADELIAPTQSKLYPDAARWLSRAKRAYLHKGQSAEWQAYITDLRSTYARRPSLQKAIAGL
jgi:uncharacterized Zn finger protein